MKNLQDDTRELATVVVSHSISVLRPLALAVIILCAICAAAIFNGSGSGTAAVMSESAWRRFSALNSASFTLAPDYSKFLHFSPSKHAELMGRDNCVSCHRRSDRSPGSRFPLHKDCIGCHLVEFTALSSSTINPICTICHRAEDLNSSITSPKTFPRLATFTAQFDHAQHMRGIESARPPEGCAACHPQSRGGIAMTIPRGPEAHKSCYSCHSPQDPASKSSSCGYCHTRGSHSATSTAARAYLFGFNHADHTARARFTCDRCHDLRGQGLPQTRQVSSTLSAQHYPTSRAQSCATCHNDQRTFGDKKPDFDVCKRCHKRLRFGA